MSFKNPMSTLNPTNTSNTFDVQDVLPTASASPSKRRVFVLGATGTIGRATVRALEQRGHDVVCFVRPDSLQVSARSAQEDLPFDEKTSIRYGHVSNPDSLTRDGFQGEQFDALVSCLASRTGAPKDAWAIDHQAHVHALEAAKKAGVKHVVLLSAICVQKPLLAFQHAKLAFEKVLIESGLTYSIVRPTAFFKSLSGQVERVKKGKAFLVFGNGELTACKPISDADLGDYLADCLDEPSRLNRLLPIGGPGPAVTPKQQGEYLFALLGAEPRFKHVPVKLLDVIIKVLSTAGWALPSLAAKAELARIGRYYATESMLVLSAETGQYDAAATPTTGSTTLFNYYDQLLCGTARAERGEHAVF
jgi:divinyl chlorophyllide a 8-vinyl-reductase